MITELNINNFKDIIDNNKFILIEFYSKTCLPCRASLSILEEIKPYYEKIAFCKIDRDNENILSEGFNVINVPTIILIKDGKIIKKEVGLLSKDKLINIIDEII